MKGTKRVLLVTSMLLVLSGCVFDSNQGETGTDENETTEVADNESNVVSRNQLGQHYYRPALDEEGRYQTSKNRGVTLILNSGININLFEKDLIRLSQDIYPTENHFIREGQYLPEGLVRSWLGRESENNPEGLNPPEEGEGDDRVPRYLNSIVELDFFEEVEEGSELAGLSIGLAMNTVDYYPAYQYGPTLEQEIPEGAMLEEGKKIADELVQRLREIEGLETLPVMISLYKQAPRDNLAGGVYIAQGQSTAGATAVESWETLNEERLIFPLQGSASAEGNAFANFQSEVEAFFPNISGITGRAHYVDEKLDSLKINIMTQFYGETEMVSYTQYLKQSAATFLPADLDVEIIVESPAGVEAFLEKGRSQVEYYSYVFD